MRAADKEDGAEIKRWRDAEIDNAWKGLGWSSGVEWGCSEITVE